MRVFVRGATCVTISTWSEAWRLPRVSKSLRAAPTRFVLVLAIRPTEIEPAPRARHDRVLVVFVLMGSKRRDTYSELRKPALSKIGLAEI